MYLKLCVDTLASFILTHNKPMLISLTKVLYRCSYITINISQKPALTTCELLPERSHTC